jgi:hypothetical protein
MAAVLIFYALLAVFFTLLACGAAYGLGVLAMEYGLPQEVGRRIAGWLIDRAELRKPDAVIGGGVRPYMLRWWLIPRNRFFNVYLHLFLRSDDDRALHDHPWLNVSLLLRGAYLEHTIAEGGIEHRRELQAGDFRVRLSGRIAHRIEIHKGPCWTLFITGPVYREWGFHCPREGWIHWERFTAKNDRGSIGAGCGAGIHEAARADVNRVIGFPGVDIDAVHSRHERRRRTDSLTRRG